MIDRLAPYAELGVDRMILNVKFGAAQAETLKSLERLAPEIMPHFAETPRSRRNKERYDADDPR